jgi:hypothetical protein
MSVIIKTHCYYMGKSLSLLSMIVEYFALFCEGGSNQIIGTWKADGVPKGRFIPGYVNVLHDHMLSSFFTNPWDFFSFDHQVMIPPIELPYPMKWGVLDCPPIRVMGYKLILNQPPNGSRVFLCRELGFLPSINVAPTLYVTKRERENERLKAI